MADDVATAGPVPTGRPPLLLCPPSGPDRLYRVGPLRILDDLPNREGAGHLGPAVEATQAAGPWCTGPDGRPGLGSLGVLLDAVLGQATINARPDGHWPVTTEMALDLLAPLPATGTLTVRAWPVHAAGLTVLSRGELRGPDGGLLGIGTEWGRFIPEVPAVDGDPVPGPGPDGDAAAVLGLAPGPDGVLRLAPSAALGNERGTVHGGVLAAACEIAAVAALPGPAGRPHRTASLHVTYLRPADTTEVNTVPAEVVHGGRSFGVVRTAVLRPDGKPAAAATVTRNAP